MAYGNLNMDDDKAVAAWHKKYLEMLDALWYDKPEPYKVLCAGCAQCTPLYNMESLQA